MSEDINVIRKAREGQFMDLLGTTGIDTVMPGYALEEPIPTEIDAEMDIRVDNGVIRNDRSDEPGISQSVGRVRGKLGRGGPLIKLRTSNGTVSIH